MIEGSAKVSVGLESFELLEDDTLLIPSGKEFLFDPKENVIALTVLMNPSNKTRSGL